MRAGKRVCDTYYTLNPKLVAARQAQRTASERKRAKRKVNQRFLTAMVDMGINLERAELALCETGNVGIEVFTSLYFLSSALLCRDRLDHYTLMHRWLKGL